MKCSMSMSSLSSSTNKVQKTPPESSKWNEIKRHCYSLSSKKSRKTLEKKLYRGFWGSTEEMSQDELWKLCLQTVQDTTGLENRQAEVREFLEDYSSITDWLNSVQAKRSQLSDSVVLAHLSEDMESNRHLQEEMNERARTLAQNFPNLKEEFDWRIQHMNSQWNSLEKILLCQSSSNCNGGLGRHGAAEDYDIHWVSRWLREMESELQPLAFNVRWVPENLLRELHRHQNLQSEIESKATLVHGALRQSRIEGQLSRKRIDIVERRWIQLRLRILEWVEHLGRIQERESTKERGRLDGHCYSYPPKVSWSDDETNEPLTKYPRRGSLHSLRTEQDTDTEPPRSGGAKNRRNFGIYEYQSMGQSHDVGTVYQSGSPVSNPCSSVIELSLGEVSPSDSVVGLKRKITSSTSTYNIVTSPQVVPLVTSSMQMNISTYYFKHSDTEAEGSSQLHEQKEESSSAGDSELELVRQRPEIHKTNVGQNGIQSRENSSMNRKWECQRNLDFSQDLLNMSEVVEEGSDFGFSTEVMVGLEEMDQETTKALQGLDEIEELVEKAELLVKVGRKRQRAATGGSFRMDLESWGIKDLQKYTKPTEQNEEESRICPCRMNPEEVGAIGGFCLCGTTASMAILKSVKSATVPRLPKRHSRVRQWVRAHNTSILKEQKSTSSCDASGESASESESELTDGSNDEPQLSSDDPTILTASTTLLLQQTQTTLGLPSSSPKRGSSFTSFDQRNDDTVILRSKKSSDGGKQRPKSFTETLVSSSSVNPGTGWERLRFGKALSPIHDGTYKSSVFASDPALNAVENSEAESESAGDPLVTFDTSTLRRKSKFRRRLSKQKKRESLDVDLEDELDQFTSNSILAGSFAEMENQLEDIENALPNNISPPLKPLFKLDPIDTCYTGSLVTDLPANDQDWDSYQEKYLSEPYSEEPFDADRTLKLLAFGEDYDQVLDRAESESSSLLSGIQPIPEPSLRKRRPLATRNEMAESDSDREEFNHFLIQSVAQLRFIDSVFRKQIESSNLQMLESPSEYAEMEATCVENMNSLKLILCNIEKPAALPFDIDIKSIQDVLNSWDLLRGRITNASKLKQIHEDLKYLRLNFESIQRDLSLVDPFDSKDLNTLHIKIDRIQTLLNELTRKKLKLQAVNEDSVGTQIYLKEASIDVRKQLKNLYALYEENLQLGSYLLDKMRFLEEAWANFEQERDAFEKSLVVTPGVILKGKKSLSSGASTDSGHGTDFSYSDSDIDEKRQKLVALRKRALDLKAFLPIGSPVLDVIDSKINEAQKDFEMIEKVGRVPLNLKLIFPKRKSAVSMRKSLRSSKSPPSKTCQGVSRRRSASPTSKCSLKRDPSRHWRALRFSLTFHFALMGLFAVAWFLQPRCCENMNTFSFSLVPHMAHDRVPHI